MRLQSSEAPYPNRRYSTRTPRKPAGREGGREGGRGHRVTWQTRLENPEAFVADGVCRGAGCEDGSAPGWGGAAGRKSNSRLQHRKSWRLRRSCDTLWHAGDTRHTFTRLCCSVCGTYTKPGWLLALCRFDDNEANRPQSEPVWPSETMVSLRYRSTSWNQSCVLQSL